MNALLLFEKVALAFRLAEPRMHTGDPLPGNRNADQIHTEEGDRPDGRCKVGLTRLAPFDLGLLSHKLHFLR